MTPPRLLLFAVLATALAAVAVRADDSSPSAVRDEAGLFNAEAARQGAAELDGVRDIYQLAFVIETVAAPPDDVRNQLKEAKTNGEKDRILRAWAQQRAGGDAVTILICKDVAHGWFGKVYGCVLVNVPEEARTQKFTDADARSLQNQLRWFTSGKNKAKNDAILLNAVSRVRDDLRYNSRPAFPWLGVGGVMAGAFAVWGALSLVRLRLRKADAPAEPEETQRLGLYHALLGGMFGNVAGHWIYDSLFTAASRTVVVDEELPAPQPAAVPAEAVEPPPPTRAERLDLAARDYPTEEEATPAPTRM